MIGCVLFTSILFTLALPSPVKGEECYVKHPPISPFEEGQTDM